MISIRISPAAALVIAALFLATSPLAAQNAPSTLAIGPLERVKVDAFAQLLSDATGRPFAVAGDVDASFTVIVPGSAPLNLPAEDVYAFGLSVLASAGLSVVEEGNSCRIVRLPEGGGLSVGAADASGGSPHGLVTRVFQLENVAADDIRRVLEGGCGKKGWIAVLESSNHLVVTDTAGTIARVAKLISELDKPGLSRVSEIISLKYADADSLAAQLNLVESQTVQSEGSVLANRLQSANGAFRSPALLRSAVAISAPHANSLILVGQVAQIAEFKKLIAELDVDVATGRGNLNAIPLRYLKAEETAKSISSLLEKSAARAKDGQGIRRIAVEANVVNNSLIVDAAPNDFTMVKQLVESLDQMPGQVHLSVLIAEVSDNDGFTWGVSLSSLDTPDRKGKNAFSAGSRLAADTKNIISEAAAGVMPQGITAAVLHGTGADAEGNTIVSYPGIVSIDALKSDGKFKILSETALQAQNNMEGSVGIVDEIPILTSTIEGGSGSSRDVIQNIERKEVGVKLKFTPHIVPGDLVRMELTPSIESVDSTSSADNLTPTISKRTATTAVTVPDGQTIVIAGLTRTNVQKVDRRIPFLGSIPILGWLFRYKSEVTNKTNLLVFVTPTIIAKPENADKTTDTWKLKTGIDPEKEAEETPSADEEEAKTADAKR